MIIGFAGRAQHGKDTAADFATVALITAGKKVVRIAIADELKAILARAITSAGQPGPTLISAKKPWVRTLMQDFGDGLRQEQQDVWIRRAIDKAKHALSNGADVVLLSDVRYTNEERMVHYQGGKVVKVVRTHGQRMESFRAPGVDSEHPSETQSDFIEGDVKLTAQSGDTQANFNQVREALKEWKLI